MTTRDPRKGPRPGDVLTIRNTVYKILARTPEYVKFQTEPLFEVAGSAWCSVTWWQENFINAEVLHIA